MTGPSPAQRELGFIESLRHRTDVLLFRATETNLRALVALAVRDLERAIALLSVEKAEEAPTVLRAAAKLADLALDRIEMAEQALGESGPDASVDLSKSFSSGAVRRSPPS